MKILFTIILCLTFNSINGQVQANAGSDREICHGDTLKVVGTGLGANDTGNYVWRNITSNSVVSTSSSFNLRLFSSSNGNLFELKVTKNAYNGTFISYDTFKLTVNPLPTFDYKGVPPICFSDCPKLLSYNVAIGIAGYDPSIRDSSLTFYQKKSPMWISGSGTASAPNYYNFCGYISNSQVPSSGARDTICFEYKDPKGCYANSCKSVRINPNPIVELKDFVGCRKAGDPYLSNMVVKPFIKTGGIQSFRCLSVPNNLNVNKDTMVRTVNGGSVQHYLKIDKNDSNYSGDYTIEYCFQDALTGCKSCDTATVTLIKLPVIKFSNMPKQCINFPLLELDSFVKDGNTGKHYKNGTWSTVEFSGSRDMSNSNIANKINNSIKSQKKFDPSYGPGQYLVKFQDVSSGCLVEDSVEVLVNGLPIIKIDLPDTVCSNAGNITLNNEIPAGNVGKWTGPGVSGNTFNPNVSNKQKYIEGPFKIKFEYTNPLSGCTASDSESILVQSMPTYTKGVVVARRNGTFIANAGLVNLNFIDTTKSRGNWSFDNGKYSNYFNSGWVSYADSGWHKAYVTSKVANCNIFDSVEFKFDYKTLGVHDIKYRFAMYPNPANNVLNVVTENDAELELVDMNGRSVLSSIISAGMPQFIDISNLAKAQYFVIIRSEGITIRERLIKQ